MFAWLRSLVRVQGWCWSLGGALVIRTTGYLNGSPWNGRAGGGGVNLPPGPRRVDSRPCSGQWLKEGWDDGAG